MTPPTAPASRRTRQHPTNAKPRILRFTAADLEAVGPGAYNNSITGKAQAIATRRPSGSPGAQGNPIALTPVEPTRAKGLEHHAYAYRSAAIFAGDSSPRSTAEIVPYTDPKIKAAIHAVMRAANETDEMTGQEIGGFLASKVNLRLMPLPAPPMILRQLDTMIGDMGGSKPEGPTPMDLLSPMVSAMPGKSIAIGPRPVPCSCRCVAIGRPLP